jgi:uncharacterized protein
VPGLGPSRERALWDAGFRDWNDVMQAAPRALPLRAGVATALQAAIAPLELAWQQRNLALLAAAIPPAEHWRLFGAFGDVAVYLDIEIDKEEGVTVVGLLDHQGPRLLMAGRDLAKFPAQVTADCLLVTFNGASFDVPVLRRAFEDWQAPPAHIDLRHVWNRLGHWGGLKSLEDQVGIGRPAHIKDLDGSHASWLWRHHRLGDRQALIKLAEYNLYDTVNLRTLAAMGWNRMVERCGFGDLAMHVSQRGDVLYDVSQILLSL